eukprot:2749359-Amphidinium_carterae.1
MEKRLVLLLCLFLRALALQSKTSTVHVWDSSSVSVLSPCLLWSTPNVLGILGRQETVSELAASHLGPPMQHRPSLIVATPLEKLYQTIQVPLGPDSEVVWFVTFGLGGSVPSLLHGQALLTPAPAFAASAPPPGFGTATTDTLRSEAKCPLDRLGWAWPRVDPRFCSSLGSWR